MRMAPAISRLLRCLAATVLIFALARPVAAEELRVSNVAERVGEQQWRWTVFVTAPAPILAQIDCVQYTLHPTFPAPIQQVCRTEDGRYPFGLTATGWGVFTLRVLVRFKNGTTQELTHLLRF